MISRSVDELVGKVRGDGVVIGFARVAASGYQREGYYALHDFELELEDGSRVRVHLDETRLQLSWPKREKTREWSSWADEPQCAPFLDDAPAPHVDVEVSWSEIRDGDEIQVSGEHERTFEDAPSHRAAPESSTHFAATRISRVPKVKKRKAPAPPREWSMLSLTCSLVALAGFIYTAITGTFVGVVGGLAFLSAALWYAYSMGKPGSFFTASGPLDPTFPNTIFWELAVLTVASIMFYGIGEGDRNDSLDDGDLAFALVGAFIVIGPAFIRILVHRHRTTRLLRIALSTPRAEGGFRAIEGMLMTDLTCTEELITIDGPGDDDISYEDKWTTNITSDRPIVVRTDEGDIRVPVSLAWFTAERVRQRPPASVPDPNEPRSPDGERLFSDRDVEEQTLWAALEGEHVLLCAHVEDGRAQNRGTNSILLVSDPDAARRTIRARRGVLALFLLITAGAVAASAAALSL